MDNTKNTAITLIAELREASNKRAAGRLRAAGRIPAILYGRGAPMSLSIDAKEFAHAFHHVSENILIDVKVGKKSHNVIVKDYSMEALNGRITHLDFLEIEIGKVLRTHVPLMVSGSAIGVRRGGVLEQPAHEIEIECLPRDLPQDIEMDIGELDIGDSLHVSDLSLGEGIRVLSNADMVLCHVATVRIVEAERAAGEEGEEDTGEAGSVGADE